MTRTSRLVATKHLGRAAVMLEDFPAVVAVFYLTDEEGEAEADARHMAACWNAYCGIPTEALEGGVIGDLVYAAQMALREMYGRNLPEGWDAAGGLWAALRKAGIPEEKELEEGGQASESDRSGQCEQCGRVWADDVCVYYPAVGAYLCPDCEREHGEWDSWQSSENPEPIT